MCARYVAGAAHSSHDSMHYLDSRCAGRWMDRNGPVVWPPKWPGLTPANSTCRPIWKASFVLNNVTCGMRCGDNIQHTWRLSVDQEFLIQHGSVMHWMKWWVFSTFICKLLGSGQMPYCSEVINSLSTFLSLCFPLLCASNKMVLTIHLYDCFCLPSNVEHDTYI